MPNLWKYESFILEAQGLKGGAPAPEEIKEALNTYGKTGYQVIHIKERVDGSLIFIMACDTGRPTDEDEERAKEWLCDVVTSDNAHLAAGHRD